MNISKSSLSNTKLIEVNEEIRFYQGFCLLFFVKGGIKMQLLRPENKDFGTKWFLYDMGLSLAGKGLLITIMMFPEKICLTDSMFYRICGDTKEVVDKIFDELEKLKYVVHIESDDTYIVYEKPNLNS